MATASMVLGRFGYPKVPGDTLESVIDVPGLASYAVVVYQTPPSVPTGGQTIRAADFGFQQSLDFVLAVGVQGGTYSVRVIPLLPVPGSVALPDGSFSTAILEWVDAATGLPAAAATNLSAFRVRLLARGR